MIFPPRRRERRTPLAPTLPLLLLALIMGLCAAACGDAPQAGGLPTLTPVQTPPVSGIYVDPAQVQGEISPLVYGSNYGPWLFIPIQMQPYVEDAQISIFRYPGGNWGERNDMDPWNIDQFMGLAEQFGAEATFHVRYKGGSPEKAAEMVRYVNIEKGYGVKYWAISNEATLIDNLDPDQYNADWRKWAEAMEAVDPTIQLVGPEGNQLIANPNNDYEQFFEDFVVKFLEANGDMVDVVSFHRYPFPLSRTSGPPTPDQLRESSNEWDELIPYLRALIREHTGRDLPIALTEVNSSWAASSKGETTLDSHANAIWWGDSLARLIRQGVLIVNQFAIINEFGLMDNYDPYPIYYVYIMYKHFGDELVFAASDQADVTAIAAQREDGALTVMIVNRGYVDVTSQLTIEGKRAADSSEAWRFDPEHNAEAVEPGTLLSGDAIDLPAQSMTLLVIP